MNIEKVLFRFHRGSLYDSMETVTEVKCLDDIYKLSGVECFGIINDVKIEHYGYDDRIDWDTFIIIIPGYGVLGFSNGMLL